ncbi:NAD(P)/FAD-dependent oxidoreductase [Mycolicibacterium novocastrense]|uniref:Lycopene cyclase protein n=1 Tax=Mycolicibacterium novocastrense TaxID=59813 RepID=A0AAW5SR48_MYCNV|nr:FAD-dependent oxidoreductase [Mycolicibacterium novocastrense]MCV7026759.1 NAD(P)/FAD-dependent oxidoreductase [Mycolicibacterium novocastrense]GAT10553.1 lycopene cyclase protein [Mycolicibacterium novocastrense]
MRTVVVGAGPAGLYSAIASARRGHTVMVVDRDAGPPAHGRWQRRGVMQFHHAHTFRRQVIDALAAEMPEVLDALHAAGAETATDERGGAVGLRCRRTTFDGVLWGCARAHHNIGFHRGNVDDVLVARAGVGGVRVGTARLEADLVLDASGRDSRFTRSIRPRADSELCGAAYVSRQYRLHRTATPPPMSTPFGTVLSLSGYWALAYLHDNATFTVTIVHDGTDPRLRLLRNPAIFEAAIRQIPALSEWITASRSRPLTDVMPGARLHNSYRGQCDDSGDLTQLGLISVGDAVCTTTPLAGRGVALALMQGRELMRILDHCGDDIGCATIEFDKWCFDNIRPWYEDHCYADAERMRRWSGHDVDLTRPLPPDLIVAAAEADPQLGDIVGPYAAMDALPDTLRAAEPRARKVYESGWRPTPAAGPRRDELIEAASRTPVSA